MVQRDAAEGFFHIVDDLLASERSEVFPGIFHDKLCQLIRNMLTRDACSHRSVCNGKAIEE